MQMNPSLFRFYYNCLFFTIIVVIISVSYNLAESGTYDWKDRTDYYRKPAGIFDQTPFPIDETTESYTIVNDENPNGKIFHLGTKYFVDNTTNCQSGDTDYDPNTRSCGIGSYTVYKTIRDALSKVSSGNKTILVRDGKYTEYGLQMKTGTDDTHRYMICGYKQERPVWDGASSNSTTLYSPAGTPQNVYFTIQRMKMQNSAQEAMQWGAGENNPHLENNVSIIDVYFYRNSYNKTATGDNGHIHAYGSDNTWIYHCNFEETYSHGIKIADGASNTIIEWSKVYRTGWWPGITEKEYWGNHAIAIDLTSHDGRSPANIGYRNIVRYNKSFDNLSYCLQAENQEDLLVHHNEFYHGMRAFDIFSDAASWCNSRTEGAYNVSFNGVPSAEVYSNVFYNKIGADDSSNEHGLFQLFGSSSDIEAGIVKIYNNLFWTTSSTNTEELVDFDRNLTTGVKIDFINNSLYGDTAGGTDALIENNWGGTVNIINNILYQAGNGSCISGDVINNNNLFYHNGGGNDGVTLGQGDRFGNPNWAKLPNDTFDAEAFQLTEEIAGTDMSHIFNTDFNSQPRQNKWDIGAYEYGSSGTTPPENSEPPATSGDDTLPTIPPNLRIIDTLAN